MKIMTNMILILTFAISSMTFPLVAGSADAFDYKIALMVSKPKMDLDEKTFNTIDKGYAADMEADLTVRTDTAGDYFNQGLSFELTGNYEKAAEYYSSAIELNAEYSDAIFNLAVVHVMLGDNISAHERYTALKEIDAAKAEKLYDHVIQLEASESSVQYSLQIGAYKEIDNANTMLKRLKSDYMNALIVKGRKYNMVRIVGLDSSQEASHIMSEVNKKYKIDSYIILLK